MQRSISGCSVTACQQCLVGFLYFRAYALVSRPFTCLCFHLTWREALHSMALTRHMNMRHLFENQHLREIPSCHSPQQSLVHLPKTPASTQQHHDREKSTTASKSLKQPTTHQRCRSRRGRTTHPKRKHATRPKNLNTTLLARSTQRHAKGDLAPRRRRRRHRTRPLRAQRARGTAGQALASISGQ